MRISASERDEHGLTMDEALDICRALEPLLDYVNVTAGTSASAGGAVHIVPPMAYRSAYLAPDAARFRKALGIPVFVAGRINQPHEAEAVLVEGSADVCGMTRALICDPDMPVKADRGRTDDIRACIACNQACIGHFHRGYPISCIQHPETGREIRFGTLTPAARPKKVMVIGGGPAGMKAAAVAAARGHQVALYEAANQLGGQALLAQQLPRRSEFGGIVTNLSRGLELAQGRVVKGVRVDEALLTAENPDAVVIATGAKPFVPEIEEDGSIQIVDAWQVIRKEVKTGTRVVVADWRCDWIGPGIAEMLTNDGCSVQLAVNGTHPGELLPLYVRDNIAAELHRGGIGVTPYARLFGCDSGIVYMQHTTSEQPILFENIDTLVLCLGHEPVDELSATLIGQGREVHIIGDSMAPRTAEEAVYEGLKVGAAL